MQLLFDFYDFDRDGHIGSLDILNLVECIPEGSVFHQEVKMIADFFIYEAIMRRINRRAGNFFKYDNFTLYMNSRDMTETF